MIKNKKYYLILINIQLFCHSQNFQNDTPPVMINNNIDNIIFIMNQDLKNILQNHIKNIEKCEYRTYTWESLIGNCVLHICIDIILILFTFLQCMSCSNGALLQLPICLLYSSKRADICNLCSVEILKNILEELKSEEEYYIYIKCILIHFIFIFMKYTCVILHKFNKKLFSLRLMYIIMYIFFISNILMYFFFHLMISENLQNNLNIDNKMQVFAENKFKTLLLLIDHLNKIKTNINNLSQDINQNHQDINQNHQDINQNHQEQLKTIIQDIISLNLFNINLEENLQENNIQSIQEKLEKINMLCQQELEKYLEILNNEYQNITKMFLSLTTFYCRKIIFQIISYSKIKISLIQENTIKKCKEIPSHYLFSLLLIRNFCLLYGIQLYCVIRKIKQFNLSKNIKLDIKYNLTYEPNNDSKLEYQLIL